MHVIHSLLYFVLHLDVVLRNFAAAHQVGVYGLLVAVIFCETGLVIWPFLPGDSLLFAVGALAAGGGAISLPLVIVLLCVAANCGDILNYCIGRALGPKIFNRPSSWLLNQRHLQEAHTFYEKHGRATIILARFVPIVRTFAPFVAGIGQMPFARFVGFSIAAGVLWVLTMTYAGFFFAHVPLVAGHFNAIVVAIVVISVLPAILHTLQSRRRGSAERSPAATPSTL